MQFLYNICHYYELHYCSLDMRKESSILSRIPCEGQDPLQIVAYISWKLLLLHIFTGIFVQTFRVWNIIIGLYQAARECGHFQAPMPKSQKVKCAEDKQLLLSAPPPKDEYLEEAQQRQTLVIEDDSYLLAPSAINRPEHEETLVQMESQNLQQKPSLQEIPSLAKLHLYWGSHPARIPSFRAEICQKI